VLSLPEGMNNPYRSSYPNAFNDDGTLKNDSCQSGMRPNYHNFQPPVAHTYFDIRQFNGYYLGDLSERAVYLTFDNGYENGFTPIILDILKEKGVHAAFFVTKPYIQQAPELCIRMIEEGHIVGNHTVRHRNSSSLTDEEFIFELEETARFFKEVTGYDMHPYFRPPGGEYSARILSLANELGYKTIFWSLAYLDYDVNNQPGRQAAFDRVTSTIHNGCIILLHAISQSNTEALGDIIDYIREQGFEFKPLDDLADW